MAPNFLQAFRFGGQVCRAGIGPALAERLAAADVRLRRSYAEAGAQREAHAGAFESYAHWCGFHERHRTWRSGGGSHSVGAAIDINSTTNAGVVLGSGAGGWQSNAEHRVVEVYDRATQFMFTSTENADVVVRPDEDIADTYDRLRRVSDALAYYFGFVFSHLPIGVRRPPIADVHMLFDGDSAFRQIRRAELVGEPVDLVAALDGLMSDPSWRRTHPGWPSADAHYWQLLRDFEVVRGSMPYGDSGAPVTATRNPARGFLDLHREVVIELVRTGGLRWRACELGVRGSRAVAHFDLGDELSGRSDLSTTA